MSFVVTYEAKGDLVVYDYNIKEYAVSQGNNYRGLTIT